MIKSAKEFINMKNNLVKFISVMISVVLLVSSCSDKTTTTAGHTADTTANSTNEDNTYSTENTVESPMLINSEAESLGWRSVDARLDLSDGSEMGLVRFVLKLGDYCCVLSNASKKGDVFQSDITLLSFDNGEVINRCVIEEPIVFTISACAINDNLIAVSRDEGYWIIDAFTGKIISKKEVEDNVVDCPVVSECDEGFVFVDSNKIVKVDPNGEIISKIPFNSYDSPDDSHSYFVQNGVEYLARCCNSDSSEYYYKLDFETQECTEVATSDDFGYGIPEKYGNYVYSDYYGTICELNMSSKTCEVIGLRKNFFVKPSTGQYYWTYILDKTTLVETYMYDHGIWDIQIIKADPDLDLSSRKTIRIMGDDAPYDTSLALAAYEYNTSQNEYLVTIESWGEEDSWDSMKAGEERNLKLIRQFQNGEGPDILYGYTLDYDYLGKSGVVIDMMPYLSNSNVINRDNLISSIYDVLTNSGHCYKLINCFELDGIFCDRSILPSNANDLNIYKHPAFENEYSGSLSAADIINDILGHPIRKHGVTSSFTDIGNVNEALEIAVKEGVDPIQLDSGSIRLKSGGSHVNTLVGSVRDYTIQSTRIENMTFLGYPTVGGIAHNARSTGMIAISSGSKYPDECFKFIEYWCSAEAQQSAINTNKFPVVKSTFEEYLNYMKDPDSIPEDNIDMKMVASALSGNEEVGPGVRPSRMSFTDVMAEGLRQAVDSIDNLTIVDFGIYNILREEIESYYNQNKPVNEIAKSLSGRLQLYATENMISD